MSNDEISKRFAEMWKTSRYDGGKTQEYMAKVLHVSRKTIQNWEDGITCPDQRQGFRWFRVLGLQPLPYYLRLIYPSEFSKLKPDAPSEDIDDALKAVIKGLPDQGRQKLLFMLNGEHGSSPKSTVELVVAYLHLPLRDRISIANSIVLAYSIADNMGDLIRQKDVRPDIDMVKIGIGRATKAVINGEPNYTSIIDDEGE